MILKYLHWLFDQITTTPFNNYQFSTPGYHNVILTTYSTLSNGQVCISQPFSQQVYVYDLPQPSFSVVNVACENNVLGVNEITNFTDLTPSSTINSISGLTDALIIYMIMFGILMEFQLIHPRKYFDIRNT